MISWSTLPYPAPSQAGARLKLSRVLSACLICLWCAALWASPSPQPQVLERWEVKGWGLEAGLPQSSVTGLARSLDGRLWVSTFAGLARFDGLSFEPLSHPTARLPIRVTHLVTDPVVKGKLWVATEGEGLWMITDALSPDLLKVEQVELPERLQGVVIYDIHLQATGPRAGVWISTDQGTHYKDVRGAWREVAAEEGQSTTFEVSIDQDGTLWSCSDRRLSRLKAGETQPESLFPPPYSEKTPRKELPACRSGVHYQGSYFALFEDALWLISERGEWLEVKVAGEGEEVRRLGGSWKQRPWISPDGKLWLLHGTLALELGELREVIEATRAGRPVQLNSHRLSHPGREMFTTGRGTIWVGTTGGGLYRLSSLGFSQVTWPSDPERSQTGPLAQTRQELWFVQSYQTLWRARKDQGLRAYERVPLPPTSKSDEINAIGARANGDVLVSREGELLSFQRIEGGFRSSFDANELKELGKLSLISPQGFQASSVATEGWWLGTHRGALFATERGEQLRRVTLPSNQKVGKILSLIELRRHGTSTLPLDVERVDLAVGHSLGVSVRRDGVWSTFTSAQGLPRGDARDLLEAPDGVIWVASYGGGLGWIDPRGEVGQVDVYDAHLSSLKLTPDQSVWLQGNKGLTRVRLSDLEGHRGAAEWPLITELLRVGEANGWLRYSAALTEDGELWLAGVNGLSVTQTSQLMSTQPLLPPQLLSAQVGDFRLFIPRGRQEAPLSYQEVPADVFRRLEVSYLTSLLNHSKSVGYEHRLIREGHEQEEGLPWVPAGASQLLIYPRLSPGKYKLQIRSVSLEFAPSAVTELGLMISHKWHELLWVRVLLGLLFITIPTLLTTWRARLISLHNQRLCTEIEQRVIAEERLREREARYRHVFNEAANAFLLYTEEGDCVEVNRQAELLFDASQEALLSTSPRALGLPPLERWSGVEESAQTPLLCSRLNGSVFPAKMSYVRCAVESQDMWLVAIMDLSAIVSAHDQQTWVLHQLSVARRMDALGRLSSGIAHDLNNILGALSGNVELLRDEIPQDAYLEESINDIIECLRRGSGLSQQLLAFSRLKTTQSRSTLDPVALVRGLERLLERLMPKDVSLLLDLGVTGEVKLDQGLFEQALLTLVLHAAEMSPAGGTVTIRLRLSRGGVLQLNVTDQGPAIPLQALSALIESDTLPEDHELSPALVLIHREMTRAHGTMSVTRREQNNQVLLEWPTLNVTPLPSRRANSRDDLRAARSYYLVVVDDNQELRRVLVRQLIGLGHEVDSYGDSLEALDELTRQGRMPDILISDVIMPGLNGRQLTSELRQVYPELKVIFISGYTSDVLGDINTEERREVLLHKPFTKEVLNRKIEELMAGTIEEA